jgi:hypothetical protein
MELRMGKAPIIVVCGMNHSGTSCIAKILNDNGADPGHYDPSKYERTPYVKYENTLFKNCCIELCKIRGLHAPENSVGLFIDYLKKQRNESPLLLKYPKSVFCLNTLAEIIGKDRIRTVFVMRNTLDAVESNVKKTNVSAQRIFQYYNQTYKALLVYRGDVFVTAFERIKMGLDTKMLLAYCGL